MNALSPGYTATDLVARMRDLHPQWIPHIPVGRLARADEMASIAVFLASPAATYVTGHNLVADGGYACW